MQLLYLASEILVLFILLVILGKKNKRAHDKILILWLSLILINTQGFNLQPASGFYFFIELSGAVVFLHGPVIWFYFRSLSSKIFHFKVKDLLHLIPFVINLVIILPAFVRQKLAPFTETERNILMVAKLISIIVYTSITIIHLNWHKKSIKDYFSSTDKKELQWLQLVLYGFLIIWILALLSQVAVQVSSQLVSKDNADLIVNVSVSLLVIIIGYYGFRQGSVFQNVPVQIVTEEMKSETKKEEEKVETTSVKYKKSGLEKLRVQKLAALLQEHMEEEHPYFEPELTLLRLSKAVNLSANDLSQVINEHFQVNFFDFINGYRVKAFKNAIANGEMDTKSLLGIALESGFNSKASFNRAFKKMTGQTPSEYVTGLKLN